MDRVTEVEFMKGREEAKWSRSGKGKKNVGEQSVGVRRIGE